MPYLHPERIVAYVPAGRHRNRYSCKLCLGRVDLPMEAMRLHLERFHGLKVSGGGYAFYREEVDLEGAKPLKPEKGDSE